MSRGRRPSGGCGWLSRWLGALPARLGGTPDDGKAGAAVVDVSRGTVSLQLAVLGQAL
ncbi:hypothetical protein AB0N65_14470 [Paenarthrobacter sp. NPDC089322]|uniref:hypothetical protein n=1 Tax=Paenarthrobacter sp. NPDC089322 TaxID=3155065 RepID=UPI0034177280